MSGVKRTTNLWRTAKSTLRYSTRAKNPEIVPTLPDSTLATFRSRAFQPETPALLTRGQFASLPATQKWFSHSAEHPRDHTSLNTAYLSNFGNAVVPLEITDNGKFTQIDQPMQFFLDASASATTVTSTTARVYLAQASLADLPTQLRKDVPTPEIVLQAGKGDVYATSIWLGLAPTYTPLHRDPNPNLFVQLAGRKTVRLFSPQLGAAIFHHVQSRIGGGSGASATMRGAEMMEGEERVALERAVWGRADDEDPWPAMGMVCEVGAGDALFIPKGWWHSIKGVGEGITGSVNWWFR